MKKVLFLTDIHLTDGDQPIIGISPKQRFVDALTQALDHHGNALHLFIMGDLAHHGHKMLIPTSKRYLGMCKYPIPSCWAITIGVRHLHRFLAIRGLGKAA